MRPLRDQFGMFFGTDAPLGFLGSLSQHIGIVASMIGALPRYHGTFEQAPVTLRKAAPCRMTLFCGT
jgi:hypothetical protein